MPGYERNGRRILAVREREARVLPGGDRGSDARHHLELDPCGGQRGRLLAAATEDVGITSLEPHDGFARAGFVDQAFVDRRLARTACERFTMSAFGVPGCKSQEQRVHQSVVQDQVR